MPQQESPQQETLSAIRCIKKTHENLVVGVGVSIGMILLVYFFTFAMFVDRASAALVWFQVITTILMAFMLVFIKKTSFFLTRLLLGRRPDCRHVFAVLEAADLVIDEDVLVARVRGSAA
jgi:hypothetical protein